MVRRLIWSVFAQQQKKEIFDYWNERNKSKVYSRKLNTLFNNNAEMLTTYPEIGRKTDFENVRLKVVKDFWLAYQITKDEIHILAIWDSHRNPDKFSNLLKSILY